MIIERKKVLNCPSDYYDYYSFSFPINALGRIAKNKYICSELEKLHPCFSDDCCFDSRIKLGKHGLKADVVVMQKYKLAEFKNQRKQKAVYIDELKNKPLFVCKNKGRYYVLVAIMMLVLLGGGFFVNNTDKKAIPYVVDEVEKDIDDNTLIYEKDAFSSLKQLFEEILSENGKITSFSWKLNGFSENFSLSLKNVYPEKITSFFSDANISSVIYQDNIPLMSAEIIKSLNSANFTTQVKKDITDYFGALRDFVRQCNIEIIEESIKPYGMSLSLSGVENSKIQFQAILDYLLKNNLPVNSLVVKAQKENMLFSIGFSNAMLKNQNELYECLCDNMEAFFQEEPKLLKESHRFQAAEIISSKNKSDQEKEYSKTKTVIGKIVRPDGTTIEFYKDQDGKIKQIKNDQTEAKNE